MKCRSEPGDIMSCGPNGKFVERSRNNGTVRHGTPSAVHWRQKSGSPVPISIGGATDVTAGVSHTSSGWICSCAVLRALCIA